MREGKREREEKRRERYNDELIIYIFLTQKISHVYRRRPKKGYKIP